MRAATKSPTQKASVTPTRPGAGIHSRFTSQQRKPATPVEREKQRLREERHGPLAGALNLAKTVLAVFVWTVLGGIQVIAVAPYSSYTYAQGALFGMAVSSAILLHLWPTRTPQWRTLFWAFWITGMVGSSLLVMGAGRMALTGATIAGYGFVLLRMNQNGRKLVELVKDWRALR